LDVQSATRRTAALSASHITGSTPSGRHGARTPSRGDTGTVTLSAQLLIFSDKGYDPVPRAALALSRGRQDRLDVKSVLGGLSLAGAPDFIDNGVP